MEYTKVVTNASTGEVTVVPMTQTEIDILFPSQSADENKATAVNLLQTTDWTTIADVGNSAMSNPYLANQSEFIAYRNVVRQYAVYPVSGNLTWPTKPLEVWQTV